MIRVNGKEVSNEELTALIKQIDPSFYEDIIRLMFAADPQAAARAFEDALNTHRSKYLARSSNRS